MHHPVHPVLILAGGIALALSTQPTGASPESSGEARFLSEVRQLTVAGRRTGEGYFGPDGRHMVFQSERSPENPFYQIYLMDLLTGETERLSPGVGKTTCAWIHPSQEQVLYASTHEDPEARAEMQAEFKARESGESRRYSWDYDPYYEIYAQDLETGERQNLTQTRGYDAEGAYSPDGEHIVFASNRRAYQGGLAEAEQAAFERDPSSLLDLYLMDRDGGNVRRLTEALGYDGGPFFSADGERITWRRFAPNGRSAEIYTLRLDSGAPRQITELGDLSWAPFFHPSGDYLIFSTNTQGYGNFELYLVDDAGEQEPVRVTFTEGFDGLPVFAPDGETLAWTSQRGSLGRSQIHMARWDDAAARRALGLEAAEVDGAAPVPPPMDPSRTRALAEDTVRNHVTSLTDPAMEGRRTGTPGAERATQYVAEALRAAGLEPAGDQGTYFQSFDFTAGVRAGETNVLQATVDGETRRYGQDADWRPLGVATSGSVGNAPVVFAGYGIEAPATDDHPAYHSYADRDVEGKWALVFRFLPEDIPSDWRRHLLHYSDISYKVAVAKRQGAVGLIVVTGPAAQAEQRLAPLAGESVPSSSGIAAVALSDGVAERWVARADRELADLQRRLDAGESVAGFTLPEVTLGAHLEITRATRSGRNVIARLPAGTAAANGRPAVMLGAHVDHLGDGTGSGSLARPEERGQLHPGADDNASGVAALLALAQSLADRRAAGNLELARPITFAAWSGEELGTLGSRHYVEVHGGSEELPEQVVAYLNMDMIGRLDDSLYLQGVGSSGDWLGWIERTNVAVGLPISVNRDPYLPTDVTPFYVAGVPVLNAFTGAHEDYSTPRDTADQLNYPGLARIGALMGELATGLAQDATRPAYARVEREHGGMSREHLRAYLGTIPAYGDEVDAGVPLQGAVEGGPADQAGVQSGDVVVELAGDPVETIQDFMAILADLEIGASTSLVVRRDGERVELTVVPGSRD